MLLMLSTFRGLTHSYFFQTATFLVLFQAVMDSSSIESQDEPFRAASCDRPMSMKVRPSAHIRSRQRPGNGTSSQYIHTGAISTGNGTDITRLGTAATTDIVEPDTGNLKVFSFSMEHYFYL